MDKEVLFEFTSSSLYVLCVFGKFYSACSFLTYPQLL